MKIRTIIIAILLQFILSGCVFIIVTGDNSGDVISIPEKGFMQDINDIAKTILDPTERAVDRVINTVDSKTDKTEIIDELLNNKDVLESKEQTEVPDDELVRPKESEEIPVEKNKYTLNYDHWMKQGSVSPYSRGPVIIHCKPPNYFDSCYFVKDGVSRKMVHAESGGDGDDGRQFFYGTFGRTEGPATVTCTKNGEKFYFELPQYKSGEYLKGKYHRKRC